LSVTDIPIGTEIEKM